MLFMLKHSAHVKGSGFLFVDMSLQIYVYLRIISTSELFSLLEHYACCFLGWNMLFFLWGIFKGRKQDSSKPYTILQQEPSGSKITLESQVHELSSYHACEPSTFQKHDLQLYPPKEFSINDETPGARTLKFNSIDNCQFVSSTVPDNDTHNTENFPSVKSSLDMVTVETESTGVSDHTSHYHYSFDHEKICPASKSNGTKSVLFLFPLQEQGLNSDFLHFFGLLLCVRCLYIQ